MKKSLVGLFAWLLLSTAQAGVITGSGFLVDQDVDWYSFSTTGTGNVSISAIETVQDFSDFDTVLFLFADDGSLDVADFIEYDDDGGNGLESLITRVLNAGNYLLAVGTHGAQYNPLPIHGGHHGGTDYSLTISGDFVTAANVPEPISLALLGLGLAGIGFARRKKQA